MNKLARVMVIMFQFEGGFVNDPRDKGGMTNKGITRKTYSAYLGREATEGEMRGLTDEQASEVFREGYWDVVKGDNLPVGLDLCVMDFAVNSGPRMSARYLQRVLGVKEDGVIGPKTLLVINSLDKDELLTLVEDYIELRKRFLEDLEDFKFFGKGWTNRIEKLRVTATKWLS